ncbi:MAG: hypothetical protein LBB48_06340 [Treponema sp.]|nr:hypothetical protein [Treponema sp.]
MKNFGNGTITKKSGLLLAVLLCVFFSACVPAPDEPAKTEEKIGTSLMINNLSDYPLISVEYSSVDFGTIKSGRDATKEVNHGTKYIFFYLQSSASGMVRCRTEALTCAEDIKNEYIITNNTIITLTGSDKKNTLKNVCAELNVSLQYYDIGDIGPGGGFIFLSAAGQYKECSGDLGAYNWNDAVTTAKNYKGGGFDNWHLPDIGELDLIYNKIHKNRQGIFFNENYWSTTIIGYYYAMSFANGKSYYGYATSDLLRVIAVREF